MGLFGFNKDKIRATAERFVQQGKLQNAIAEYDKILKQDPKDLTVLNTVGDLYARLGQVEQAVVFFKLVGDTYASEGFVPRAIAIYKKLTNISPNTLECVQKLGELYTQQGLYNDARRQFMAVADAWEKEKNYSEAIKAYLRIRDLDPENGIILSKLAKLYKSSPGKKDEAVKLLLSAAENFRSRNMLDAADEAMLSLLDIDSHNARALEMRGHLALERGNPVSAAALLEKVPDIDSRPESMEMLLRCHLLAGHIAEAEPVARKLITVHNDVNGIFSFTDKLFATDPKRALEIYAEFSDRLISSNVNAVVAHLRSATAVLSDDIPALEAIHKLFIRAGDNSQTSEIEEMIAHASVKKGDLDRARELYLKLVQSEPENPTHAQNYRQVMVMLGTDPSLVEASLDDFEKPFANVLTEIPADDALTEDAFGPVVPPPPPVMPAPEVHGAFDDELGSSSGAGAGLEFGLSEVEPPPIAVEPPPIAVEFIPSASAPAPEFVPQPPPVAPPPISVVPPPPPPTTHGTVHEIDISAEWETAAVLPTPASEAEISDLVEEIHFYITQSMWDEAGFALAKLAEIAPANSELERLRTQIATKTAEGAAAPPPFQVAAPKVVPPPAPLAPPAFEAAAPKVVPPPPPPPPTFEIAAPELVPPPAPDIPLPEADETIEIAPPPKAKPLPEPEPEPEIALPRRRLFDLEELPPELAVEPGLIPPPSVVEPEPPPTADAPPVSEAKPVEVAPVAEAAPPPPPEIERPVEAPHVEPVRVEPAPVEAATVEPPAPAKEQGFLGGFVHELEDSLGNDFAIPAPSEASAAVPEAPPAVPMPPPVAAVEAAPPPPATPAEEASIPDAAEPERGSGGTMLDDLFQEFKDEMGDNAGQEEDPETHYSLGVAFREMGLLDEAIGELQKVCLLIERGVPFSQPMQAYTWLAHCFVEQGVPEASFKWYQRALSSATDDNTRTAVHYEMAAAYEAAGFRQEALVHYMEVYTSNIDYRDVGERIKALRS